MSKEETMSAAFNAGSDARIAGVPYAANPYYGDRGMYWGAGWRQCERQWAVDAKWPTLRLPQMTARRGVA